MTTSRTCTFTNERGQRLSARLDRPDGGRPVATALFAHCFTCSKDLRVERQVTAALTAEGIAVLSFDFAGLGRSGGDFADSTFSSDVADLRAAAAYLRDELDAPALLVGHSLGGAAVLSVAADIPEVRAVATIAAPADPAHVEQLLGPDVDRVWDEGAAPVTIAGRTFTIRRSFLTDLQQQRPRARLARFDGAVLLFHSPVDDVVGIDNAELLYRAARHPRSFVSLDRADHLLSEPRDASYVAAVTAAWAGRYITDDVAEGSSTGYQDPVVTASNSGGFATTVATRGFVLTADEPRSVGGTERGPGPYDLLGAALASCTAMTIRMYADRKGWQLSTVDAAVSHDRVHADDCANCEHVDGRIDRFERVVRVDGDLDDVQRGKLRDIADRCPVHRTLEGQIEVHTTLDGV